MIATCSQLNQICSRSGSLTASSRFRALTAHRCGDASMCADMNISYIYALLDPRSNEIRYVGKTINLRKRLARHCRASKRVSHKHCWIRFLQKNGVKPTMKVLEEVINDDESVWQERERFWIAKFKSEGVQLTNADTGGRGGKMLSEEVKAKISKANAGRKRTAETRAKISAVMRNLSQETRRRMSEAGKKRRQTPEHCENIRRGLLKYYEVEEHRKNVSRLLTGRKRPKKENPNQGVLL